MKASRFSFFLTSALIITLSITVQAQAESWGLLLYKEGTGSGRVCVAYDEKNECQVDDANQETNIELNEHIKLRATAEPGSHFVQWVGDCRGRSATCEMQTLKPRNNKPLSATAIFALGSAKPMKADTPIKKSKRAAKTTEKAPAGPREKAAKSSKKLKKTTKKKTKKSNSDPKKETEKQQ